MTPEAKCVCGNATRNRLSRPCSNSRQNDQHAKKGKTEGSARGRTSARNTGRGVLAEVSERKHLTSREVERLIEATKGRRNEVRDRCLLLLMFRHGLRVSEACGIKLDQVDTESRVLHVARLKGGLSTTQPLRSYELRAISAWLKERARMKPIGKASLLVSSASGCIDRPSTCS
jgi:site-specific recombinase XerC